MAVKLLDVVVLKEGLSAYGLQAGDVGTVVEVYGSEAVMVEFLTASGDTVALVTLAMDKVRGAKGTDMLTVRTRRPHKEVHIA